MYTVLVAMDDNEERAASQVETVIDLPAAAESIEVVLLHVFTDNPEGASVHQLSSVKHANKTLEDAGVEVTMAEASGDPATEIIAHAEEHDVDMILVSGRARSPAGKALLGSTSQRVLLDADRPVLFTSAGEH